MAKSRHEGGHVFPGEVVFGGAVTFQSTMVLPANVVSNSNIPSGAGIGADKVNHQFSIDRQLGAPGADVASVESLLKIVRGASAVVVAFKAFCETAPDGGDKAFTVDLQKNVAGVWTSILTAPLEFDDTSADFDVQTADLASTALVAGDVLRAEVVASGSTGTQGQGLLASLTLIETPA